MELIWIYHGIYLPSGKRLQKTNWKITMLLMGKSTISMGHFQSQTVCLPEGNIQPPNWSGILHESGFKSITVYSTTKSSSNKIILWFFLDITNQK